MQSYGHELKCVCQPSRSYPTLEKGMWITLELLPSTLKDYTNVFIYHVNGPIKLTRGGGIPHTITVGEEIDKDMFNFIQLPQRQQE